MKPTYQPLRTVTIEMEYHSGATEKRTYYCSDATEGHIEANVKYDWNEETGKFEDTGTWDVELSLEKVKLHGPE